MTFYSYRNRLEKQMTLYLRHSLELENRDMRYKLLDEIVRLKRYVLSIDQMTVFEAQAEINETEEIHDSKINFQ